MVAPARSACLGWPAAKQTIEGGDMGIIRKSVRAASFMTVGVPLAHKRSKKDHIVRNTARAAAALEVQQATPPPQPVYVATPAPPVPPPQPVRQGPPPGWYADPGGTDAQRWWDGTTWTEHLQG